MPPSRPHRRALLPLALLTAGALATLAICWLPAAYFDIWPGSSASTWVIHDAPPGGPAPTTGRVASISINENARTLGTGWDVMYSTNTLQSGNSTPPLRIPLWLDPTLRPWATTHDGIERLDSPDWPDITFPRQQYAISAVDVRAFGWPMRAMYTVHRWTGFDSAGKGMWSSSGALTIAGTTAPDRHFAPGPITLPLLIRPLGFIIDTLAFALIFATLLLPIDIIRRTLRRRRNQCPRCAYDLSATPPTSPCPECGQPHSAAGSPRL